MPAYGAPSYAIAQLGQALGLEPCFKPGSARLFEGIRSGFRVEVRQLDAPVSPEAGVRVVVLSGGRLPPGVELSPAHGLLKQRDAETGDPGFDREVLLRGAELDLLVLLDHALRQQLREFLGRHKGLIRHGQVELGQGGLRYGKVERIVEGTHAAVSLLASLPAEPPRPDVRLAAQVRADPQAGVRWRSLRLLEAHFAASPEARAAADAVLDDPDLRVRIQAAKLAEPRRALAPLRELLSALEGTDVPAAAEVLRTLIARFPYPVVAGSVGGVLGHRDELLCGIAADAVGAARDVTRLEALCARVPRASDALAVRIARNLGRLGDARAESALLSLLERDSLEVQRAAAEALGRAGTVGAVEALLRVKGSFWRGAGAKDAARRAVRAIQARLHDAEAGRLSLVPESSTSGAVSLGSPAGAVSVPPSEDEPGSR